MNAEELVGIAVLVTLLVFCLYRHIRRNKKSVSVDESLDPGWDAVGSLPPDAIVNRTRD